MNRLKKIALTLYVVILITSCGHTQIESDKEISKAEKIDQLISTYANYGQFNGTILVAENGIILYKKAFGLANMEWDIPNNTNTKFRLASVTKQFTSMLILQLVAEGKLDLHKPISTYLKDYPKPQADKITIHHLLTHTSGIPNYTSFPNYWNLMRNPISPSDLIKNFADSTLKFTPGERFNYSNSGYVLLGNIIETVTKKNYAEILQEKIFSPLGMKGSGYYNSTNIIKHEASGYFLSGSSYKKANYIDMSVSYAAGGIYSTVEDLYRWDQALYTEKLLPKKYLDSMFLPYQPIGRSHYAYGWNIAKAPIGNTGEEIDVIDHDGVINGFSSLILRIPSSKSTIIILNNTSGAPINHMAKGIIGILYNKTYDLPIQSTASVLAEKIKIEGLSDGLVFFNEIKDSPDYYINENEMNLLGYEFFEKRDFETAKAIFELNIKAFPNSFNVYDSYGEVLIELGDLEAAITNYKKSIELNSKNNNAKEKLKELIK